MTPVRCDSSPRTGERVWQPFVEDKVDRVLLLHLTTRSTGIQQSSPSSSLHVASMIFSDVSALNDADARGGCRIQWGDLQRTPGRDLTS